MTILFILLLVSYALLSYNYFGGWYDSSIGTLVILILSYLIWDKGFLVRTGLQLNPKKVLKTFILTAILIIVNFLLIKYIADKHKVLLSWNNWRSYYHIFFYTLNEEIMIGALPLMYLVKQKKISPLKASAGLAVIFSLVHFIFYKWVFNDRGNLELLTLISLFMVGFIRNDLIVRTGHVGYSWALHFSWIAIMFGTKHSYIGADSALSERTRFNLYLGSPEMIMISGILAVFILVIWLISSEKARKSSGNMKIFNSN